MDQEEKKGTENQKVEDQKPSYRDLMRQRIADKYPDLDIDDEEAFMQKIHEDYDGYDSRISGYQENESVLGNLLSKDPRTANILVAMKEGKDPVVAMIELFGEDFKNALEDPEKLEDIGKAHQMFLDRVAKDKEYEAEYEKNLPASLKMLEEMKADKGYTDEQIEEAMSKIAEVASDFMVGKITPETMSMMFNAINHDRDVEEASAEGEIRGRNAKIETKKLDTGGKKGDGLPSGLGGGHAPVQKPKGKPLGALDRFGDSGNIWDRGSKR